MKPLFVSKATQFKTVSRTLATGLVKPTHVVVGKTYLLKDSADEAIFVTAVGKHPIDQFPAAFGKKITLTEDGHITEPLYIHLDNLGSEV